jgi:hypothetical protein
MIEASPILVALRGDIRAANRCVDKQMRGLHKLAAKTPTIMEKEGIAEIAWFLPPLYLMLARQDELASILQMFGLTWGGADNWYDAFQPDGLTGLYRPRGSDEYGAHFGSVEAWSWLAKLAHVLSTASQDVDRAEVLASLPSPARLQEYIDTGPVSFVQHETWCTSLPLLAAEVCEAKLEAPAEALAFADLALSRDTRGPDVRPTTLIQAETLRARVLATQGRPREATAAFEAALELARRHGLRLLELRALLDHRRTILRPAGRAAEAAAPLPMLLQEMDACVAAAERVVAAASYHEAVVALASTVGADV